MKFAQVLALLGGIRGALAIGRTAPPRFLLATSPETHNIYYAKLPSFYDVHAHQDTATVGSTSTSSSSASTLSPLDSEVPSLVLIDGQASRCEGTLCTEESNLGLQTPTDIAIHSGMLYTTLYVYDSGANTIYAYNLTTYGDVVEVGEQKRVREGLSGNGNSMNVDGLGNLFYFNGAVGGEQTLFKIPVQSLELGTNTPEAILASTDTLNISPNPGAIVLDNFYVYWANAAQGLAETGASGSVARAPERMFNTADAGTPLAPRALAANAESAFGICLALDNVFFTTQEPAGTLFAVKTRGGAIAEVSHAFQSPKGCVYDDESTIYVADSTANAIYQLPANFQTLRAVRSVTKVTTMTGPTQLAIFSSMGSTLLPQNPALSQSPHAIGTTPQNSGAAAPGFAALLLLLVASAF